MRKRKSKYIELSESVNETTISTPSPDYDVIINGTDIYWSPVTIQNEKNRSLVDKLIPSNL